MTKPKQTTLEKLDEIWLLVQKNLPEEAAGLAARLTIKELEDFDERFGTITAKAGSRELRIRAISRAMPQLTPIGLIAQRLIDLTERTAYQTLELHRVLATRERLEVEDSNLPDYAALPVGMSKDDVRRKIQLNTDRLNRARGVLRGDDA